MSIRVLLAIGVIALTMNPVTQTNAKGDDPSARIQVAFVHPEKFTDIKDRNGDNSPILPELKRAFQKEANDSLPGQFQLSIRFTNIDLAGEFEWWRGPAFDAVRVIKDLYPPRMTLTFKLSDASGRVLKEGQRHLQNQTFLLGRRPADSNPRQYEQDLFADWLRQEFREFRK